ncbi:MAG TPA: zincin-like metallopeptidase domain-containing protein [Verrucomicrobiota bacterium]|nr:zincin-like metallopeptidase domain-containing protein [Verrucomicrobiota bacterium]
MNVYQTVTDRILKALDAGVIPWRKTWTTGLPKSLTSGREYRGVNVLVLGTTAFTSRYWVTYREAQRLGGHVRKGERATPVIYWKWRTAEELAKRREATGQDNPAPCVPFAYAVFNLDQVEGVGRPGDDVPNRTNEHFDIAEQMLAVMPDKPEIVHQVTAQPAYSPRLDRITLPHLSQFESAAEYYATLWHELTHSTGAKRRLNRFEEVEGDRFERYSIEELVAEFGAAFLCALTGVANVSTDALQASYINGWAAALRKDVRLVLRAASAAQRAVDYIRGQVAVPEHAPDPVAMNA